MSKKFIIIAVIILALGAGGYFLYTSLAEEDLPITAFTKISKDFEMKIFADTEFSGLKRFIVLPEETKIKGKINPFMKF